MTGKQWMLLALALAGAGAGAATLRLEGIQANSGTVEQPVLYGPDALKVNALGVAFDPESGILYERAGSGVLNAYRLDGRLVATYQLPTQTDHLDRMVRCGDYLVLLLRGQLHRLKVGAPDKTVAEKIPGVTGEFSVLSGSARDGKLAVLGKDRQLWLLDPASGKTELFGKTDNPRISGMDWGPDGKFYLVDGKTASRLENGKELRNDEWPKTFIGRREAGVNRAQALGKYWFGSAGHGTIKRFDADFEPAPGVVQGGASGHFIGYVPCNYEIESGRGMAEIRPGLYAISGLRGVIQLAEWRPELKQLKLVRRIGGLPTPGTLAVDSKGRIFAERNIWNWEDEALAPAWLSLVWNAPTPVSAAYVDPDTVVMLATRHGQNFLVTGKLAEQELYANGFREMKLPREVVGLAAYRQNNRNVLLTLGSDGQALLHEVAPTDRRNNWRKNLGEIQLQTSRPVKTYTSCAMLDPETLVAAADGQVIFFGRDGQNWKESARWSDSFGPELKLAASNGRLLVSDRENNRVAVYDGKSKSKLAEAGVNQPGHAAFNGPFVVVYEIPAQRLLKLKLED